MPKMLTTGPNGITAKARKHVVAEMIGAKMKTALSAAVGMMSSFSANLMPSAKPCNKPKGPDPVWPDALLHARDDPPFSPDHHQRADTRKTKMKTALISDSHHGVSAKASVTVTAAFTAHHPRPATPGRLSGHQALPKSHQ